MQELKNLVTGYKKFLRMKEFNGKYRYQDLAEKQSPETMIISCCDSRVNPALIFNTEPGELFIVRNIANLIPPFGNDITYHGTSAAIEFAVLELGIKRIIVMGHANCGGIRRCINVHETPSPDQNLFIDKWLSILAPVTNKTCQEYKDANKQEVQTALEKAAIKTSLKNLKTFPFISENLDQETVKIHGAYFDIEDGQLYLLNEESDDFEAVE